MAGYFDLTHTLSGSPFEYASQEYKGSNVAITLYVMDLNLSLYNMACWKYLFTMAYGETSQNKCTCRVFIKLARHQLKVMSDGKK